MFINLSIYTKIQTQKKKIRTHKSKKENDLIVHTKIPKMKNEKKIRVQKWKEVQKGFGNKQIKNNKSKERLTSHRIWGHGDQ